MSFFREKLRQKIASAKKNKKQNNAGMTLTELIVSFALLALFMVAAMRIISYTVNIYFAAKGATYGLEVSNMISNKIVGQIEGAKGAKAPVVTANGSNIDEISFMDSTGSNITVSAVPFSAEGESGTYMNIHYDEVTEGSVKYDAVDWKFDSKAYMGYVVRELKFEKLGANYPTNVIRMKLVLHSERYGDYTTEYYIKCANVSEVQFE